LQSSMLEMGADRIMFSVDYPFEKHADAATWFDRVEISENDRRRIGRDNAVKLFNLDL
jgi:predicted TIM-barrel fold metal-dependent hydrolase